MSLITVSKDGVEKQLNSLQIESATYFFNEEDSSQDSYIVQLANGEQYSITEEKYNEIKSKLGGEEDLQ